MNDSTESTNEVREKIMSSKVNEVREEVRSLKEDVSKLLKEKVSNQADNVVNSALSLIHISEPTRPY